MNDNLLIRHQYFPQGSQAGQTHFEQRFSWLLEHGAKRDAAREIALIETYGFTDDLQPVERLLDTLPPRPSGE